jgi:hypothetical protein
MRTLLLVLGVRDIALGLPRLLVPVQPQGVNQHQPAPSPITITFLSKRL